MGILLALLGSAVHVGTAAAEASPRLARIEGRVTDEAGQTLAGLEVTLVRWGWYIDYSSTWGSQEAPHNVVMATGVTDGQGEFSLDVYIAPHRTGGFFIVQIVDPNGHFARVQTTNIPVDAGHAEYVEVRMRPGGSFGGVVTDRTGAPVADVCATYYLVSTFGDGGSYWERSEAEICTDASGTYDSGPIHPGAYEVSFARRGDPQDHHDRSLHRVVIRAGEEASLDVVIENEPTGRLNGTIVSAADGAPVPGCVFARPVEDGDEAKIPDTHWRGCTVDGGFASGPLVPGRYHVAISPSDGRHLTTFHGDGNDFRYLGSAVSVDSEGDGVALPVRLGASIAGRVMTPDDQPATGVTVRACLQANSHAWPWPGTGCPPWEGRSATVDANGDYRIDSVGWTGAGESFFVSFTGPGFAGEWWSGDSGLSTPISDVGAAQPVPITLGVTASGIDAVLSRDDSTIAGLVTDSVSGEPIEDAVVQVAPSGRLYEVAAEVSTDAAGAYALSGLEPGSYTVSVIAIGYATARSPVELDVETPPVNVAVVPQGAIEGVVSADKLSASTPPWRNEYCVTAAPTDGSFEPIRRCRVLGTTYRISKLPAGTYNLTIGENSDYTDISIDGVVVEAPATTTQDAVLIRRPTITGSVRDSAGEPVVGIEVCALPNGSGEGRCGSTNTEGAFDLPVGAGGYLVKPEERGDEEQWEFIPAAAVEMTVGDEDASADFVLARRPVIHGTLMDDSDGRPACGVEVQAHHFDSEGPQARTNVDCTTGAYSLRVDPGEYKVRFRARNSSAVISQWWSGAADFDSADTIELGPDDRFAASAQLELKPTVDGQTSSDVNGDVLAGVVVRAFDEDDRFVTSAVSDEDGQFELPLLAGDYRLHFRKPPTGGDPVLFAPEWWSNELTLADADVITVLPNGGVVDSNGEEIEIEVDLREANVIEGTVLLGGSASCDARVQVFDVEENQVDDDVLVGCDGSFRALVGDGEFKLHFTDRWHLSGDDEDSIYVPEWWHDVASFDDAAPIVLEGAQVETLQVDLATLPTISGRVNDTDGNPVVGADVNVDAVDDSRYAYTTTGADGRYSVYVPEGDYRVDFGSPGHVREWWDDQLTARMANVVSVGPGGTTADAELATGAVVSGTINNSNGDPVPWACVYAYTVEGTDLDAINGGACADASGNYTFRLPIGQLDLELDTYGYEKARRTMTVPPEGLTDEDFVAVPWKGRITGEVTRQGEPVEGACLRLYTTEGGELVAPEVCTTADGTFEIDDLQPQLWRWIGVSHPDGAVVTQGQWVYVQRTAFGGSFVSFNLPADSNGDGIHDGMATGDGGFALGGTLGAIIDANGHVVTVEPDPNPPDGGDWVLISVTAGSEVGPARLTVCGTSVQLPPGSTVSVSCGSLLIDVQDAPEPIVVELVDGAVLNVAAGTSAYVNDEGDGTYTVEHRGGSQPMVIVLADDTSVVVPDGVTVEFEPGGEPGEFTVRHLAGDGAVSVRAPNGTEIATVGPDDTYTSGTDEVPECNGRQPSIVGTAGGGVVNGTSGNDVIWVPAGSYTINAGNGNDVICTGPGTNTVLAGAGNDVVIASDGDDTIDGGAGNDRIDTGGGTNIVNAGAGNDTVTGGVGDDEIEGGDGNDNLAAGDGTNEVRGGADNDTITSGAGDDTIYGDDGNDTVAAGGGHDYVEGGAGNDQLRGEDGNDTLIGGAGNDRLEGGPEVNTLDGNTGNNTCVLGGAGSTAANCKI